MTVAPCTEIILDSRFEETRRLGPWLATALGDLRSESAVDDLELALVELVTNIVEHGHAGEAGHPIHLLLFQEDGIARIEIHDRGRPVPPEAFAGSADAFAFDPEDIDGLPTGGMGLALVYAMVDHLDYRQEGDGNVTTIVKGLSQSFWCSRASLP